MTVHRIRRHTLSVYITFQSATDLSQKLCFVTVYQRTAGPLGHWLACDLVIMGEPGMEVLMMTMPVLPIMTYSGAEAVLICYCVIRAHDVQWG